MAAVDLQKIIDDTVTDVRIKILAYNRQCAKGNKPQKKELLAVIVEIGLDGGLVGASPHAKIFPPEAGSPSLATEHSPPQKKYLPDFVEFPKPDRHSFLNTKKLNYHGNIYALIQR